jgi:hypothetical protein
MKATEMMALTNKSFKNKGQTRTRIARLRDPLLRYYESLYKVQIITVNRQKPFYVKLQTKVIIKSKIIVEIFIKIP